MEGLKPCPSCGKKCLAIDRETGAVACMLCGMRAPSKDAWNRRAAPENDDEGIYLKAYQELLRKSMELNQKLIKEKAESKNSQL